MPLAGADPKLAIGIKGNAVAKMPLTTELGLLAPNHFKPAKLATFGIKGERGARHRSTHAAFASSQYDNSLLQDYRVLRVIMVTTANMIPTIQKRETILDS